jgi:hypothetical protein
MTALRQRMEDDMVGRGFAEPNARIVFCGR